MSRLLKRSLLQLLALPTSLVLIQFTSSASPFEPRSCEDLASEFTSTYAQPLACARKKCPRFRLIDGLNEGAPQCTEGCGPATELINDMIMNDEELSRCESHFNTIDLRDYFSVIRCMSASKSLVEVIEPYHLCSREHCPGSNPWQDPSCQEKCNIDLTQLVEIGTATFERCASIEQALPQVCKQLLQVINVCFVPEQCDQLSKVHKEKCES